MAAIPRSRARRPCSRSTRSPHRPPGAVSPPDIRGPPIPRLASIDSRQSSGVLASTSTGFWAPAAATNPSSRPNRSITRSTSSCAAPGLDASPGTAMTARSPSGAAPAIAAAARSSTSARRAWMPTRPPSRTIACALARPMPADPPVSAITRPSSRLDPVTARPGRLRDPPGTPGSPPARTAAGSRARLRGQVPTRPGSACRRSRRPASRRAGAAARCIPRAPR